jgi:hypothetical protein
MPHASKAPPKKSPKTAASAASVTKKPKQHTKLHYCDIKECEGICCSDGAFVLPEEEVMIHKVVKKYPEHFKYLPKKYIGDSSWGDVDGRKTATRPYQYQNKPAHFANTRCAFAEKDGKCGLQTLAVKLGKHKWEYKPMGCWLFPLSSDEKGLIAPPRTKREDPNNLGRDYPGFSTHTPCGTHSAKGKVWWIALKEEVSLYRELTDE